MSHPKREKAKKTIREDLLDKPELNLSQVADLVDSPAFQNLFRPTEDEWQRYFQSPVDKAAHSVNKVFEFNHLGALQNHKGAEKFLLKWLEVDKEDRADEVTRGAINKWLASGDVLAGEALDKIAEKLKKETLPNQALYNQLICRLVRRNQLRYDPDYQIIYQLTPGQSRLIEPDTSNREQHVSHQSHSEIVDRNRRTYWGISEVFQSLIAMFDSELGKVTGKKREGETKEFIRIEAKSILGTSGETSLTPSELNKYSPLRFWAPPPVFARCVFHMIFWRSIITNKDLYGRKVIEAKEKGAVEDRIKDRVDYYYVIINWFNAAKYRIANYDELFLALMAVAQNLVVACGADTQLNGTHTQLKLSEVKDVRLESKDIKKWFYPTVFEHTPFNRPENPRLWLPFGTVSTHFWELARRYQEGDKRREDFTRVSDFLKFLRDRALELILWSKYQMEIRSIGIIPIQHLYRLELTDEGETHLKKLVELYDPVAGLEEDDHPEKLSVNKQINEYVSAVKPDEIDRWIKLVKVYGGIHREIVEPKVLQRGGIKWLEKSGRKRPEVDANAKKMAKVRRHSNARRTKG